MKNISDNMGENNMIDTLIAKINGIYDRLTPKRFYPLLLLLLLVAGLFVLVMMIRNE